MFYAMEFVDGETAEALVRRRGPLPVRLALRIILQAAQGLAAAAERGLIHRDIKPANLMLARPPAWDSEGSDSGAGGAPAEDDGLLVKVIDFGIAKDTRAAGTEAPTLTGGHPIGTPAYMSPEQISPSDAAALDARTDIYSLGVTLWFLLTGRQLFEGSDFQIFSQHTDRPPPFEKLAAAGAPPEAVELLRAMLAKDRDERPANHGALIASLRRLLRSGGTSAGVPASIDAALRPLPPRTVPPDASTLAFTAPTAKTAGGEPTFTPLTSVPRRAWLLPLGLGALAAAVLAGLFLWSKAEKERPAAAPEVAAADKSIAVLPFENRTAAEESAGFADGVQDEILTCLAKVADLRVIARSSVQPYRAEAARNLPDIAKALGVAWVLEGSVQRAGPRVRVSARLTDARTGAQRWAETYDRDLADVFAIQSEVGAAIVRQLQARLSPAEQAAMQERGTTDLAAYDEYLRAKDQVGAGFANLGGRKEVLLEAMARLEKVVARDPAFLRAWCLLARAHDTLYFLRFDATPARREQAARAVEQAAALRADSGEARLARANHLYQSYRDYAGARRELAPALARLPNDPEAHALFAYLERREGRIEESVAAMRRALELDPRNASLSLQQRLSLVRLRRFDEAFRLMDAALAANPGDFSLRFERARLERQARGDTAPLRRLLYSPEAEANVRDLALQRWNLAFYERDYPAALQAIAAHPQPRVVTAGYVRPRSYYEGRARQLMGDADGARPLLLAAREECAALARENPEDEKAVSVLARVESLLGNREEALRLSERACELMPPTRDYAEGIGMQEKLMYVCIAAGETGRALDLLEYLFRVPSDVSPGTLRVDPDMDPIRGEPRFQAILARYPASAAKP